MFLHYVISQFFVFALNVGPTLVFPYYSSGQKQEELMNRYCPKQKRQEASCELWHLCATFCLEVKISKDTWECNSILQAVT